MSKRKGKNEVLKDSEAVAYFEQLCNGEGSSDEFSSEWSDSDDEYVPDENDGSDFENNKYVRSAAVADTEEDNSSSDGSHSDSDSDNSSGDNTTTSNNPNNNAGPRRATNVSPPHVDDEESSEEEEEDIITWTEPDPNIPFSPRLQVSDDPIVHFHVGLDALLQLHWIRSTNSFLVVLFSVLLNVQMNEST